MGDPALKGDVVYGAESVAKQTLSRPWNSVCRTRGNHFRSPAGNSIRHQVVADEVRNCCVADSVGAHLVLTLPSFTTTVDRLTQRDARTLDQLSWLVAPAATRRNINEAM